MSGVKYLSWKTQLVITKPFDTPTTWATQGERGFTYWEKPVRAE